MEPELEFLLLGPLVVRSDSTALAPSGKQRTVLAALLLNADRVVSVDELIEILWGDSPPPSARVTVQNHVMRLRKTLGRVAGSRLSTQPPGYRIRVNAGELDVSRFETHLNAARAAARGSEWDAAAAQARAALALWRGQPLEDVHSELLASRQAPRLGELRMQAVETRIAADLHRGRHAEVIAELRQLVSADPLRENLHELLILALYRDGRRGDALAAYRQARRVLVDELGTEPGSRLRELHRQVLAADPALEVTSPVFGAVNGSQLMFPRQLPRAVSNFTGRAAELAALTRLLEQSGRDVPATMVISAIGGTAGVGKTALAVQWAHQVADQFPDGQLYVNLRGYDPDQPVTAADALAGFLSALGVDGQNLPADEAERAAQYRSLLAGKRVLIVLDNASDVGQVRPLLPATPGSTVVVTSRDSLAGLVARDGANRLELDLLPLSDAVALLRQLTGRRTERDRASVEELAAQCCRLPLALRVAAELAAARPAASLHALVTELGDQQRRLDMFDTGGDPRSALRAVFSWSYDHLDVVAARAFRLIGFHPGSDLELYAVAALADITPDRARHVLDVLARAHLIQPAAAGRYGLHDLLRAYARELAASTDGEQEEYAALTRLFDYYQVAAAAAMDLLFPAEAHRRPRLPSVAAARPAMADEADARAWLERERANLVSMVVHCAGHGWPRHATDLAATLFRYLMDGNHFPEALVVHDHARWAANRAGDRAAEAIALNGLAGVHYRQGRYHRAAGHLEDALAMSSQLGDRAGEARTLDNLSTVVGQQGQYEQAADLLRRAASIYRELGDRLGEARSLDNLGVLLQHRGHYEQAARLHRRALAIHRELGDGHGEAYSLDNLGTIDLRQGNLRQATSSLEQSLTLFRQFGDRVGEADVLVNLGAVILARRRFEQAADLLEEALALSRETGELVGEAEALNGLGEVLLATGAPERARAQLACALDLASRIGDKPQQARAHDGLGQVSSAIGDLAQARRHWREALTLYTALDYPEADQVRSRLGLDEAGADADYEGSLMSDDDPLTTNTQ